MTALDHSSAPRIVLVDENGKQTDAPALPLPPKALRFFAEVLKLMAQQQPMMLLPQKHVLTTQEAAGFLIVSRPFVIKEIEAGRLKCTLESPSAHRIPGAAAVPGRATKEVGGRVAEADDDVGGSRDGVLNGGVGEVHGHPGCEYAVSNVGA